MINYIVCRSSKANDVEKIVYGSEVPVLDGEKLSLRSLVCLKVGVFTKCVNVCVLQMHPHCCHNNLEIINTKLLEAKCMS